MSKEEAKLILICGLPGAGKTTLAKELESSLPGVRFCPDEWMEDMGVSLWEAPVRDALEKRFWELGQQLLGLGQTVILEYGFWGKSERDEKLQAARKLGVGAELYYLNPPLEEIKQRLSKRGQEGDNEIASEKIEEYDGIFERPDEAELRMYDNHKD